MAEEQQHSPEVSNKPSQRLRCKACGNLTRFEISITRRTVEFWHFGLDGNLVVESTELSSEVVNWRACIKCGSSETVVKADEYGQAL